MNRVLGVAIVTAALGVWGGVRAWQSASVSWNIQAALAIVIGGNLILCLWVWYRARPGSGDAMLIPTISLLSAAMLVGILPRVFWPAAEGIHIAGSIASLVVPTVVLIMQIRRRRIRRRGAGPA
jgi:hypothetical protein